MYQTTYDQWQQEASALEERHVAVIENAVAQFGFDQGFSLQPVLLVEEEAWNKMSNAYTEYFRDEEGSELDVKRVDMRVKMRRALEDVLNEQRGNTQYYYEAGNERVALPNKGLTNAMRGDYVYRQKQMLEKWIAENDPRAFKFQTYDMDLYIFASLVGNSDILRKLEVLAQMEEGTLKPLTAEEINELQPPEVATLDNERPALEAPALESQIEEMSYSLNMNRILVNNTMPAMLSGALGLHHWYQDESRRITAMLHEAEMKAENDKESAGARQPALKKDGRFDKETLHIGNIMLEAATHYVEYRNRGGLLTEIRNRHGSMYRKLDKTPLLTIGDVFAAYKENAAAKNLDLIDPLTMADNMIAHFEELRKIFNQDIPGEIYEEWISRLYHFVPHEWVGEEDPQYPQDQKNPYIDRKEPTIGQVRTVSKRAAHRRVDTYMEGIMAEGYLPRTLNLVDLDYMYQRDVAKVRMAKMMVSASATMRNLDGSPIVMLVPAESAKDFTQRSAIDLPTARRAVQQLALYLNEPLNKEADYVNELRRLIEILQKREPGRYELLSDTRLQGIGEIYVESGGASNVMKMLVGRRYDGKFVKALEVYNAWSKYMAIAVPLMSIFHPFSLLESGGAAEGLITANMLLPWNWKKTWNMFNETYAELRKNPETLTPWIRRGLGTVTTNPDVQTGIIDRHLANLLHAATIRSSESPFFEQTAKMLDGYIKFHDAWQSTIWNKMLPVLKFHTAEHVFNRVKQNLEVRGIPMHEDEVRDGIARYVNNAFGGQEWASYIWATPKVRQMLHLMFFAPDWSLSAANVSGITNLPIIKQFMANAPESIAKDEMMRRYWPAMAAIVIAGIPNMLQAAIYAVTRPVGDPDDRPFTFMNETGKKFHVDVTPLVRQFGWVPGIGYEGGDTGKRRVYLRWAKQAFEVFEGWAQDFDSTLLNKTSMVFKTAWEQASGTSVNGWTLPFKDQGLAGALSVDGEFLQSRAGYVVKKFVPFSLLAMIESQPVGWFAPASRGASKWKLTTSMAEILDAYAGRDTYEYIKNKDIDQKLNAASGEIIQAAIKNGYDPDKVVTMAVSKIRSKYYGLFFKALNKGDKQEMEEIAHSILRLNGKVEQVLRSMKDRLSAAGKEISPAETGLIHELFSPNGVVLPEGH